MFYTSYYGYGVSKLLSLCNILPRMHCFTLGISQWSLLYVLSENLTLLFQALVSLPLPICHPLRWAQVKKLQRNQRKSERRKRSQQKVMIDQILICVVDRQSKKV